MVNRSIQAKILKRKRRGRFARFSGATSKTVTKIVQRLETEGEDRVRVKDIEVFVGLVSLSKQVPKGKGPNQERIAQYYDAVKTLAERPQDEIINQVKDPRYAKIWKHTPVTNRINLVQDEFNRLDLFWHGSVWFFVNLDFRTKTITRSRDYGSRRFAMNRLEARSIQWVEQFPIEDR